MNRREITETVERELLFDSMFLARSSMDSITRRTLRRMLLELPTTWTVIDLKQPIEIGLADKWRTEKGEWNHGQGQCAEHNILGMAYAQWATERGAIRDIVLDDRPDFSGRFDDEMVVGDIGKCSTSAAMQGVETLESSGPLWITVASFYRQILIEFLYNPVKALGQMRRNAPFC